MTTNYHHKHESSGDVFDILGSYRRRVVLALVSDADGPVPRPLLAKRVVAADEDKPVEMVTESEQEQSAVQLHHVDLPRLSDADLVDYDTERGLVDGPDLPLEGDEWLEMPVVEALETWDGWN